MRKQSKNSNIFQKQILHESLLHEQVEKEYRIGGVKIQGGWLQGTTPQLYKAYLKSAMQLRQLQEDLANLKQNSGDDPVDMFRIAELEKKTQNFELLDLSPRKKRKKSEWSIYTGKLVLQKMSDYWGVFERQCWIEESTLYVKSEKQKKQITIDLTPYTLGIEDKSSMSKETSIFTWKQKYITRLYLKGEGLRTYCIYGPQNDLKDIIKKNNVKKTQISQIDFFKEINQNYFNKIMVSFGNKLRMFDHYTKKQHKKQFPTAYDLLGKGLRIIQQEYKQPESGKKKSPMNSNSALFQKSFSSSISQLGNKNQENSNSNIHNSPMFKPNQSSVFRMRSRRSTIFYDQLDHEERIYDGPDYNVNDINLEIKQVALSEQNFDASNSDRQSDISSNSDQFINNKNNQDEGNIYMSKKKSSQILGNSFDSQNNRAILQKNQQYLSESQPDSSAAKYQKTRSPKQGKLIMPRQQYQIVKDINMTHRLAIGYFQSYFPYNHNEIIFQIIQLVTPEIQYKDMKETITNIQQLILYCKYENIFYSKKVESVGLLCSSTSSNFLLVLKHGLLNLRRHFSINLNKVNSVQDCSQFIYMKREGTIQEQPSLVCAGKLKIMISPIQVWSDGYLQEKPTINFLKQYLLNTSRMVNQKYRFINYKRRNCEIRNQWNGKLIKKIIQRSEQQQFEKCVFLGIPQKILAKIRTKAKTIRSNTSSTPESNSKNYYQNSNNGLYWNYINYIERQLKRIKISDFRMLIEIKKYTNLLMNMPKNTLFQQRFTAVNQYIFLKYGKQGQYKLMAAYIIEISKKIGVFLNSSVREQQIIIIIQEYLLIQYEIDQLFMDIAAYFV